MKRRAQSLVEISLVLPLFIVLIAGFLEFARYINARFTIQNAAREGARLLARVDQSKTQDQLQSLLEDTVKNYSPNLRAENFSNISYSIITDETSAEYVQVNVSYLVPTVTPIGDLLTLFGGEHKDNNNYFQVNAQVREKKEQVNYVTCPNCGAQVEPGANFCPNCGAALK